MLRLETQEQFETEVLGVKTGPHYVCTVAMWTRTLIRTAFVG